MALYDWTKFNPGVKLVSTKKKFFNQFYYSLKYHVPKCRIICYWSETDADTLRERVAWANDSNNYFSPKNSKYSVWYNSTQNANYDQLIDFAKLHGDKNRGVKFRLEGSFFTIYAKTESELYEIANNQLQEWGNDILQVTRLQDDTALEVLDEGNILVKKSNGYEWKVLIKEGFYNYHDKNSVANYLISLGDQIKISNNLLYRLQTASKYQRGGYFYTNDPRIADIIKLISPGLIGTIHKLVITQHQ